jgi:hypothetical protein
MVTWGAPGGGEGILLGLIFVPYVTAPWWGAFVAAARRPTLLRLTAMAICSVLGAALLVPTYYESIFLPSNSTSALTLAVFPFYQGIALLMVFAFVRMREQPREG